MDEAEDGKYWESAYSKLIKAPNGRIFCFYCYNTEHVDISNCLVSRYDMSGSFCYRYSDDGKKWSKRFVIPVSDFEIDKMEPIIYQGNELRLFWNVSDLFIHDQALFIPLNKISTKDFFMCHTEGLLLKSENVFTNPENSIWQTLPDGTFQKVFRTVDGYAGTAFSYD